ncbi:MAG: hypothetical protein PF569_05650 [Candidatus Woesearchaeota archaeon]|nr:hypothetical protein [Candidatus Woesearchaeota archaeon]
MKSNYKFSTLLSKRKEISYIFLGVGLLLFVLNITSLIGYVNTLEYPFMLFNISIFGSMLLVVFAVYEILERRD